jgi:hypothetical protein
MPAYIGADVGMLARPVALALALVFLVLPLSRAADLAYLGSREGTREEPSDFVDCSTAASFTAVIYPLADGWIPSATT